MGRDLIFDPWRIVMEEVAHELGVANPLHPH